MGFTGKASDSGRLRIGLDALAPQSLQYIRRKPAQRIIPRTHYDDAVTGPRDFQYTIAAFFTAWDIFGVAASGGDRVGDALATYAFVHRAAEIDGVAKNEVVVLAKQVSKYASKFRAHDADGAVTMWLEKGDDAPGKGLQRRKRCGNLVRVMAKIIDDGDVIGGANNIKAAGKTAEAFHAANGLLKRDTKRNASGDSGKRVGDIVPAGDNQRHGADFARGA